LRMDGDTARMTAIINYGGRVWYNPPVAPEMSASCGTSGLKPRARIEVVTPIRLTPSWRLNSKTQVRTVEAYSKTERDQCEVTVLKFDVTGKVVKAARDLLEKNTKTVDAKIAAIDLRSKFEEWWSVIQQPIHLSDSVWLVINPRAVHVHQPKGVRRTLRASIGLTAEPRVVVGRKPVMPVVPLPRQAAPDDGANQFHVLLEGVLAYDVASKLLTEELRGEKVSAGGRDISVRNVRMFGIGGGKIALQVDFAGSARGRVFFVGTPHYSFSDDRLYVPDLEYDVATENILVRGVSWLKHDDLRDYLRNKARWPVGGLIKQAHEQLMNGLNRELSPGVRLSGTAHDVEIVGVHAAKDAVRVRAHTDGKLRLDIQTVRH
jgi:hypothetical protein